MVPYTIKVLLDLISEKQQKITVLQEQILSVQQRLEEEVWCRLRQLAGRHDITGLSPDLNQPCGSEISPLGYCIHGESGTCIFCQQVTPVETENIVFQQVAD